MISREPRQEYSGRSFDSTLPQQSKFAVNLVSSLRAAALRTGTRNRQPSGSAQPAYSIDLRRRYIRERCPAGRD